MEKVEEVKRELRSRLLKFGRAVAPELPPSEQERIASKLAEAILDIVTEKEEKRRLELLNRYCKVLAGKCYSQWQGERGYFHFLLRG